jgi:hypothetical protein
MTRETSYMEMLNEGEESFAFGCCAYDNRRIDFLRDWIFSYTEMNELTGRGGPENYDTKFSGTIYNGNESVVVTEIEIRETFTNDEQRVYKDTTKVFPLRTSMLYFSILSPGSGFKFGGWSVDGAKGYDKTSADD